jgi:CheY-like chemotaxis protein
LIDDDPVVRRALADVLAGEGHAVTSAGGGQEGIDLFRDAAGRDESFDVVITDLGMPNVDGAAVIKAIKTERPETPVVLLTGWGRQISTAGPAAPKADCVLSKPPSMSELHRALHSCVRHRTS